ncbi:MAG: CPBP family intramembrane metalloprotease [Verrucomicrobiaceae bacterium]|nr:CPBP family intramembrane metalloprotease [Verrucomicrobiaceae bacterium]
MAQIGAPQPSWWYVVGWWFAVTHLLRLVTVAGASWSPVASWLGRHTAFYHGAFFAAQLCVSICFMVIITRHHRAALWLPKVPLPGFRDWRWNIGVPLVCWQCWTLWKMADALDVITATTRPDQLMAALGQLHHRVSGDYLYGPSLLGTCLTAVTCLLAPFVEEPLFSGCVANRLVKLTSPVTATLATSGLFAISHLPQEMGPERFFVLWLAGATYTSFRLLTGRLASAIALHLLVNVLALIPRCGIAWIYFTHAR